MPVGSFQKVGECLYRYSSNGVYYARIKSSGKEIRRSLENTEAQGVIAQHRASGDPRNRLGLGTCTVQPSWFLLAMLVRIGTFYFHCFNSGG